LNLPIFAHTTCSLQPDAILNRRAAMVCCHAAPHIRFTADVVVLPTRIPPALAGLPATTLHCNAAFPLNTFAWVEPRRLVDAPFAHLRVAVATPDNYYLRLPNNTGRLHHLLPPLLRYRTSTHYIRYYHLRRHRTLPAPSPPHLYAPLPPRPSPPLPSIRWRGARSLHLLHAVRSPTTHATYNAPLLRTYCLAYLPSHAHDLTLRCATRTLPHASSPHSFARARTPTTCRAAALCPAPFPHRCACPHYHHAFWEDCLPAALGAAQRSVEHHR